MKSRGYCFTFNNYKEVDKENIKGITCRYMVFGEEVAPSTGTPHLQGYIYFDNPRSVESVRKLLGCHVEPAKGSAEQNSKYCSKDAIVFTKGVAPVTPVSKGDAERSRWSSSRLAAEEGRMKDIDDQIYVSHYSNLKAIRRDFMVAPVALVGSLPNIWLWGAAGTGKTTKAWELAPTAFLKDAATKWWDGYTDQDDVIVDDLDPYMVKMSSLYKQWSHHFPFNAETKGGSLLIRPKRIIVTSQYHPRQVWSDDKTIAAIERRFEIISHDGSVLAHINCGLDAVAAK